MLYLFKNEIQGLQYLIARNFIDSLTDMFKKMHNCKKKCLKKIVSKKFFHLKVMQRVGSIFCLMKVLSFVCTSLTNFS